MLLIGAFILISAVQAQYIYYKTTDEFELIWNDKGKWFGERAVSIWRPKINGGWCRLGDVAVGSHNFPLPTILIKSKDTAVKPPTDFTKIWSDLLSGAEKDVTIYKMIAPPGYTCLGDVAVASHDNRPSSYGYCCVKDDYIVKGELVEVYNNEGNTAKSAVSIWTAESSMVTDFGLSGRNFRAVANHNKPEFSGDLLRYDDERVVLNPDCTTNQPGLMRPRPFPNFK